jgi:phosphate transport system substrate-binding protein
MIGIGSGLHRSFSPLITGANQEEANVSLQTKTDFIPARRSIVMMGVFALALAIGSVIGSRNIQAAGSVEILETGSSLLHPLSNLWVQAYTHSAPGVKITGVSTSSGTGIAQACEGIAQIGASDAYMSGALMK